jgi:hypothetical protein
LKKLGIIFIALVLAVGYYAMPAKAIAAEVSAKDDTKVVLSGEIRMRGAFTSNGTNQRDGDTIPSYTIPTSGGLTTLDSNGKVIINKTTSVLPVDDHVSGYDGRVRLQLDAKVAEGVTGRISLENESTDYAGTDSYTWGASSTGARGSFPQGNTKRGSLNIREAWIDYSKDMYGLTVGHMPLYLGNKLFFDHAKYGDDAILVTVKPTKEFSANLLTFKMVEGATNTPNDTDGYVGILGYKGGNFNLGADVTYVDVQAGPTVTATTYDGTISGYQTLNGARVYDLSSVSTDAIHLWNIGLRGDYTFSGVTLRVDGEKQYGAFQNLNGTSTDMHLRGWAAQAGVDYKIADTKITLEYTYGSGQKDDENSNHFSEFITTLGDDQHFTYVYDYKGKGASRLGQLLNSGAYTNDTGIANTNYVKLGANSQLAKDFSAEAYLFWLHASQKVSLNPVNVTVQGDSTRYRAYDSLSSDLGWELDGKMSYDIAKNLKYYVEGGYMWTGNAYNYADSTGNSNMYAVRHGIQLNF